MLPIFGHWKWLTTFKAEFWRHSKDKGPSLPLKVRAKNPIPVLRPEPWFPKPDAANSEGLVAIGGDLSVERLLLAYRSGIFPWTVAPLTWWSPDQGGFSI